MRGDQICGMTESGRAVAETKGKGQSLVPEEKGGPAMESQVTRKEIIEEKEKLKEREVFTSEAFQRMMDRICGRISRTNPQVILYPKDPGNLESACFDGKAVHINVTNPVTRSLPELGLKALSLKGMLGHECGHDRFTPPRFRKAYGIGILRGQLYPEMPEAESKKEKEAKEELEQRLNNGSEAEKKLIMKVALHIHNILEDVFIENAMSMLFPGSVAAGISLNNLRLLEQCISIKQSIKKDFSRLTILINLLLQYARSGDVCNYDNYEGEILDVFSTCLETVDDAVIELNPIDRYRAVNRILILFWDAIKEQLEKMDDMDEEEKEKFSSGEVGREWVSSSADLEESEKETEENESEEEKNGAKDSEGSGERNPFEIFGEEEKAAGECQEMLGESPEAELSGILSESRQEIQKIHKENGGRFRAGSAARRMPGYRKIVSVTERRGAYTASREEDFERILNVMAEKEAVEKRERALTARLRESVEDLPLTDIHTGCRFMIIRSVHPSAGAKECHDRMMKELKQVSRKLSEKMEELIRGEEESYDTGLVMGRHLDMNSFARPDHRYFANRNIPDGEKKLAVCVLVDESGSMSWEDRSTYARTASLVLYDFCHNSGIPVSVYGHTEDAGTVKIFSYADYGSVDGNDRYRLMDISARSSNRDGAALIFAAEQLLKRPEEKKLLILISDGQPAAYGYMGEAACEDLRGIKKYYRKRNVELIAAAVGDDKDVIEEIYGDGFLDISDLARLPERLVNVVMNYME